MTLISRGGAEPKAVKVEDGKLVAEPEKPTREGYTFVEWQLDGQKYDFKTPVKKDITLKAKWKLIYTAVQEQLTKDDMIEFALVFRDKINSKIPGTWEQQTFLTTEQLKEKVPAIVSYDLYAPIVKVANVEKIEIYGTTFTNENNSFSLGIGNNVFYKDYVFKYDEETKILYVNKAAMVDSLFMENYYVKINDDYLFKGDLNDINDISPKDDSVKFTCSSDGDTISKKEDTSNEYDVTIKNRDHLLSFDYDTGINEDMFIIRSQYIKGTTKYKPTISFDNYSEKGFYLAGSSEFFNEPYTVEKELVVIGSDKSIKGKLTFIFNVTTTNT